MIQITDVEVARVIPVISLFGQQLDGSRIHQPKCHGICDDPDRQRARVLLSGRQYPGVPSTATILPAIAATTIDAWAGQLQIEVSSASMPPRRNNAAKATASKRRCNRQSIIRL